MENARRLTEREKAQAYDLMTAARQATETGHRADTGTKAPAGNEIADECAPSGSWVFQLETKPVRVGDVVNVRLDEAWAKHLTAKGYAYDAGEVVAATVTHVGASDWLRLRLIVPVGADIDLNRIPRYGNGRPENAYWWPRD